MKTKRLTSIGRAFLLGSLAISGPAAATDLVYGSWLGAKSAEVTQVYPPYFDALREASGGEINWTMVAGGQIANAVGSLDAVKEGLMDAGLIMAPYTPGELPASNLIFSQSLLGDDLLAAFGAMNQVAFLECPECTEEIKRNNAVAFGGLTTLPYLLLCRQEVKTVEDVKGLRVRSSGASVAIATIAGATPVAMSGSEMTQAMERGALDCIAGSVSWLETFGLLDITTHILNYPLGMAGPAYMMYMNRDAWLALTPEQRALHIQKVPMLVAANAYDGQLAVGAHGWEMARERGIVVNDGGDDWAAVMDEHFRTQTTRNIETATAAGVKDAAGILERYAAAYDKWLKIIDEIGDDREAYTQKLWDEVYSKVDPEAL